MPHPSSNPGYRLPLFISVLSMSLLLLGCSVDPAEDVAAPYIEEGFPQGVKILDLQPGISFTASFAKGEHAIVVTALRGTQAPEHYRQEPSFPQYEVDARITDEAGRILYVRRGGDHFVDPTWEDDLAFQDSLPPATSPNVAHFEMLPEAMAAIEAEISRLGGQDGLSQLGPELGAVKGFSVKAPALFAASELEVLANVDKQGPVYQNTRPEAGGGGSSSGSEDGSKYFISGWYKITLHDKSITAGVGRHSATRIHQLRYSGVYAYYDFCNHGTCAGDMGQIGSLSQVHKPAWTALTCSTEYSQKSQDGGHNCHDDSRTQMAAFVFGASMTGTQYWCNDGNHSCDISNNFWYGDQEGSPEANDSTSRGYNHPSMHYFYTSNTASATQNYATFNIVLSAGATYDIYTCNYASGDTYLRLYKDGVQVSSNDDNCGTTASYLTYTPPTTGTYQVRAGCFGSNTCSGNVRVRLAGTTTSPPSTFYSVTNTNSALQNTRNLYYYLSSSYTYTFSTCGNTDTDTYLRLKTSGGVEVASNDDNYSACPNFSRASTITFKPTSSGGYYIHGGCFAANSCSAVVTMTSVYTPPVYEELPAEKESYSSF